MLMPSAEVVTGGTSWSPESFVPAIMAPPEPPMDEQPASAASASDAAKANRRVKNIFVVMEFPPGVKFINGLNRP
jgi:hypothetical protein